MQRMEQGVARMATALRANVPSCGRAHLRVATGKPVKDFPRDAHPWGQVQAEFPTRRLKESPSARREENAAGRSGSRAKEFPRADIPPRRRGLNICIPRAARCTQGRGFSLELPRQAGNQLLRGAARDLRNKNGRQRRGDESCCSPKRNDETQIGFEGLPSIFKATSE